VENGRAGLSRLRLTREMRYKTIVQSNPKSFSPGAIQLAAGVLFCEGEGGRHHAVLSSIPCSRKASKSA
jgi:hypothetical protein